MTTILVVCTANICRSPVVMALLRDRLAAHDLEEWRVISAGTWAYPGQKASQYSVLLMEEQGLDISNHQSQPVDLELVNQADLILTLELGHAEALRAEFPSTAHKVFPLTEMSGLYYSVRDPYGGSRNDYERMVTEVAQLIEDGLDKIIELAGRSCEPIDDSGQAQA